MIRRRSNRDSGRPIVYIVPAPSSERPWTWGRRSHSLVGLDARGPDGLGELGEVTVVLGRIALGEVGDGDVEGVVLAEVGRYGHGVTGAGVCPGERPPAQVAVEHHGLGAHLLDGGRPLHVPELAPVEVAVGLDPLRPAEEDVA